MDDSIKKINERLGKSENSPIDSEKKWYRTNRFCDWLFDTLPYGWRVYYKCHDIKRWFIIVLNFLMNFIGIKKSILMRVC